MHATPMLVLGLDEWGADCLDWHPQTFRLQIRDDFGADVAQPNLDRLLAAVTILKGDDFYRRLPVFNELCRVLSGDSFRPEVYVPADAMDCAWGITEATLMHPPEGDEPFDDEIRRFIGAVCDSEGILSPPDVLRIGLRDPTSNTYQPSADGDVDAGILEMQQRKSEGITQALRESAGNLFAELEALPLKHGKTEDLQQRLLTQIRQRKDED
jgi:hypothetical protein